MIFKCLFDALVYFRAKEFIKEATCTTCERVQFPNASNGAS